MATFHNLKELIRALSRGQTLLDDMFSKRKTVAIHYDDALDTLDGDESRLQSLIRFGIILQTGDTLELDGVYQEFFENVLAVNEDINVASVRQYVGNLNLAIDSWLAASDERRKQQLMRDIRHLFRTIAQVTAKNIADLQRNVNITYKQEPDFKVKALRLKDFDDKRQQIGELIRQTEAFIAKQPVFFKSGADVQLLQTISDVRAVMRDSAHALIDIGRQIVDYLNRIEYQSRIVAKIRRLKYLKDQFLLREGTDIMEQLAGKNPVWMEPKPKYVTRVSIDFLRNDDTALSILQDVRKLFNKKAIRRSKLAGPIAENYLEEQTEQRRVFNHRELFSGFVSQGDDLYSYIVHYPFHQETSREERLVLFVQLASQYEKQIIYTGETGTDKSVIYPIIRPK